MKSQDITLEQAIEQYLEFLKTQGKHPRTLYTYGKDCEQILAYFGPEKRLSNLLPAHVARFLKSDELLKIPGSGKGRAPATVNKTKRVLRMLLTWTQEEGYLTTLPLPRELVKGGLS